MNTTISHIFVGIDISKKFLDVHLHPLSKDFRVANSQAGISKLIQILSAYTVVQIVIDAQMIVLFASQKRPKYHEILRSQDEQKLCALVKLRTNIVRNIVQENNKLQHPQQVYCKNFLGAHISFIERQLQEVEQEIEQLIQANESATLLSLCLVSAKSLSALYLQKCQSLAKSVIDK